MTRRARGGGGCLATAAPLVVCRRRRGAAGGARRRASLVTSLQHRPHLRRPCLAPVSRCSSALGEEKRAGREPVVKPAIGEGSAQEQCFYPLYRLAMKLGYKLVPTIMIAEPARAVRKSQGQLYAFEQFRGSLPW